MNGRCGGVIERDVGGGLAERSLLKSFTASRRHCSVGIGETVTSSDPSTEYRSMLRLCHSVVVGRSTALPRRAFVIFAIK